RREIVRDLDFVVATKKPEAITKFLISHPLVESMIAQGPTKTSVRLRSGIQCDLRVVTSAEYPFALNYFSGSKENNIEMRSRALQRGWTLNEYRLAPLPPEPRRNSSDSPQPSAADQRRRRLGSVGSASRAKKERPTIKIPEIHDEADLYRAVGLDFIPPE